MSHELRTPLAPILLWARALSDGSVPPHEVPHAVSAIVQSAESQLRLIEDLRDLSRLKSGRVQLDTHATSVEEVASDAVEVIRPSAEAKGVTVDLELAPDLGDAVFDRGRIQQVLWNLLSNAVKFTPEGGRVWLRVRKDEGHLEAVVADTGAGIDADFLPHLFQRFRQARADTPEHHRYGGLGVGLALCRYLVELHGGTVEGSSEGPGRGAVFKVRIPWVTPDEAAAQDVIALGADAPAPTNLRGLKVLLVEDDENMRDIMRWTLESVGASVMPVSSGAEAIEVIEAGERAQDTPDVMVCDLGLPGIERVRPDRAHQRAPPRARAAGHPGVRGQRVRARGRSRSRHRRRVRLVRREADDRAAPHRRRRGARGRRVRRPRVTRYWQPIWLSSIARSSNQTVNGDGGA